MIRLSRLARARLGYTAGLLTAAAGSGLQWGLAVGLMVGGVLAAASFLLLLDVDERSQQ